MTSTIGHRAMRLLVQIITATSIFVYVEGWKRIIQYRGGASSSSNGNEYPPRGNIPPHRQPPVTQSPELDAWPPFPEQDRFVEYDGYQQPQGQGLTDPALDPFMTPSVPGESGSGPNMNFPYGDQSLPEAPGIPSAMDVPLDMTWEVPVESTTSDSQMDLSSANKEFILKGLARLYRKKILPLELASRYGHFHSPPLSPSDFDAPPLILLLGQYSVGKVCY